LELLKNNIMNTVIRRLLFAAALCSANLAYSQETGIAAVYDDSFQGSRTASGQMYDKDKLTAAHKIHPMGTQLKVTRTDERARRSVIVTVNDRGPYISGRIVDLSRAAAQKIGLGTGGTANVIVEVIGKPETETTAKGKGSTTTPATPPADPAKVNTQPSKSPVPVVAKTQPAKPAAEPTVPNPGLQAKSGAATTSARTYKAIDTKIYPLVRGDFKQFGLYKIALHNSPTKGFGVQVMALSNPEVLLDQIADLQGKWFEDILVSIQPSEDGISPIYKIILGPFTSEASASVYADNLKRKHKIDGFVVDLSVKNY
jgi:rare lipoprotein A